MMLPALMLTSCDNGNEIKDEDKIKELKNSIAEKASDLDTVEARMTTDSTGYDKDVNKNVNTKSEMTYKSSNNEEFYLKTVSTKDGEKSEGEVVLVNNETYQRVLYVSTSDGTTVYGYQGNEITFAFAALYFIVPRTYIGTFKDPTACDFSTLLDNKELGREYNSNVKYYSTGDGNLTIKASYNIKGTVNKDDEEYASKTQYTIVYDDYHLKSVDTDATSNKNNKSIVKMDIAVKESVSIELPNGWEDLINKSSTGE